MYRFYSIIQPPAIPEKHSHTIRENCRRKKRKKRKKWEAIHLAAIFCAENLIITIVKAEKKQGFSDRMIEDWQEQ
jgi:hypothetical protein